MCSGGTDASDMCQNISTSAAMLDANRTNSSDVGSLTAATQHSVIGEFLFRL